MKRAPRWITKELLLAVHDALIAEHGGASGVRDAGLIEASLEAPRHLHAYEPASDVCALAARLALSLVRNHPFVDGNKRTAFLACGVFLERNGRRLRAPEAEVVTMLVGLAEKSLGEKSFALWLRERSRATKRPG